MTTVSRWDLRGQRGDHDPRLPLGPAARPGRLPGGRRPTSPPGRAPRRPPRCRPDAERPPRGRASGGGLPLLAGAAPDRPGADPPPVAEGMETVEVERQAAGAAWWSTACWTRAAPSSTTFRLRYQVPPPADGEPRRPCSSSGRCARGRASCCGCGIRDETSGAGRPLTRGFRVPARPESLLPADGHGRGRRGRAGALPASWARTPCSSCRRRPRWCSAPGGPRRW